MRQRAKQLCYAMIYGMGVKSLAESLSVTESEAKDYLEAFMGTYKGIRTWLKAVSEQARVEGFVSSLTGRKRSLSGINSNIPAVKCRFFWFLNYYSIIKNACLLINHYWQLKLNVKQLILKCKDRLLTLQKKLWL